MSKATFKTRSQTWDLQWTLPPTPEKKYNYGRERRKDTEFLKLGKKAQDARQREMEAYAAQREREAVDGTAPSAPPTPAPRKLTAIEALTRLEQYSKSGEYKVETNARHIVADFIAWLGAHAPAVDMRGVTCDMACDYARDMHARGYCTETIKHYAKRLGWIFRHQGKRDGGLNNPFVYKEMLDALPACEKYQREHIRPLDFQKILDEITRPDDGAAGTDESLAFNLFAVFYIGIVTGWRAGDIVTKKWADIKWPDKDFREWKGEDFAACEIRNYHQKTRKSSALKTVAGMTKTGAYILKKLQSINGTAAPDENIFILSEKRLANAKIQDEKNRSRIHYFCADKIFGKLNITPKMERGKVQVSTTSFHSFRGTIISYLLGINMSDSLVHSLVGHAPRDIEGEYYTRFTPEHYRACMEQMERRYFFPALAAMMGKRVMPCFLPIVRKVDALGLMRQEPADTRARIIRDKLIEAKFYTMLAACGLEEDDLIYYFKTLERQDRHARKVGRPEITKARERAALQREREKPQG